MDYFVKHNLKAKFYIRYVDDFVILHFSKKQLEIWKDKINDLLTKELRIKLHPDKSRVIFLKRGVDFVGFRNFYRHKLLRKRNVKNMERKIKFYEEGKRNFEDIFESFKGWEAYAKWGENHKITNSLKKEIIEILWEKVN